MQSAWRRSKLDPCPRRSGTGDVDDLCELGRRGECDHRPARQWVRDACIRLHLAGAQSRPGMGYRPAYPSTQPPQQLAARHRYRLRRTPTVAGTRRGPGANTHVSLTTTCRDRRFQDRPRPAHPPPDKFDYNKYAWHTPGKINQFFYELQMSTPPFQVQPPLVIASQASYSYCFGLGVHRINCW